MYKKNFYKEMKDLKGVVAKSRDREMGEYWLKVRDFLTECNYTTYKYARELVNLSLEGYNDVSVALKLNIEEGTVRTHKRNLSNILYNIFGDDFFELFTDFKVNKQELHNRLRLANILSSGKDYMSNLLPIDVLVSIREYATDVSKDISFDIQDCKKEISFLARYNSKSILKELSQLNKDKLGYIISGIEGDRPLGKDLYNIINYIEGGLD